MTVRIFIITKKSFNIRKGKGSKNICHTCNIELKIGDVVVTKKHPSRNTSSIRHEVCARSVNLID